MPRCTRHSLNKEVLAVLLRTASSQYLGSSGASMKLLFLVLFNLSRASVIR